MPTQPAPQTTMQTFDQNKPPELPSHLSKCPICVEGHVVIEDIDEIEQNDDGTWQVSDGGLHITCSTEPDLDSEYWDDWFTGHFSMPYMDWLPVQMLVLDWLNSNYRVNHEDES